MPTMTIYIDPPEKAWVDLLMVEQGYRSRSAYIRSLVWGAVRERLSAEQSTQQNKQPVPEREAGKEGLLR